MNYDKWLAEFTKDKKLLGNIGPSTYDAVYDLYRYIDEAGQIWETAITYTGRLVVRSGLIAEDRVA